MIKCDYHMHSDYSMDGNFPIEVMIQSAINKGLTHIAITDHFDFDYPCDSFIDYGEYKKVIDVYKEKYKNIIEIAFGVELGLTLETLSAYDKHIKPHQFDFIIGSTHSVHSVDDIYFGHFQMGREKIVVYNDYFERIYNTINKFQDFCVYGHFDYVARYGNFKDKSIHVKDHMEILEILLKRLIEMEKGIEINTSSFKYGQYAINFYRDLFKFYKDLGGEIVTVGSDAHSPDNIAQGFDIAKEILKYAGFERITIFHDKKPLFIKFD